MHLRHKVLFQIHYCGWFIFCFCSNQSVNARYSDYTYTHIQAAFFVTPTIHSHMLMTFDQVASEVQIHPIVEEWAPVVVLYICWPGHKAAVLSHAKVHRLLTQISSQGFV